MEEYEFDRYRPIGRWVIILLVLLGLASAILFRCGRVLYGILTLVCFLLILFLVLRQYRINRESDARTEARWREEEKQWQEEERQRREEEERRRQEERKQRLEQLNSIVATVKTSGQFVDAFRLVDALGEEDEEEKARFKEGLISRLEQLLQNSRSLRALEGVDYIASQVENDSALMTRLESIVSSRLPMAELQPRTVQHISSKGRPCYYTGQVHQVQRKKKGNLFYYDMQTAKPVTVFIYKDFFEWMAGDDFRKLAIKNIMNLTIDSQQPLLTVKPTTKDVYFFYGRNVKFIKCVIDKLQLEITQSW